MQTVAAKAPSQTNGVSDRQYAIFCVRVPEEHPLSLARPDACTDAFKHGVSAFKIIVQVHQQRGAPRTSDAVHTLACRGVHVGASVVVVAELSSGAVPHHLQHFLVCGRRAGQVARDLRQMRSHRMFVVRVPRLLTRPVREIECSFTGCTQHLARYQAALQSSGHQSVTFGGRQQIRDLQHFILVQ